MSEAAQEISACPLALSTMRTAAGICRASQTPVAMPQPTSSLPSRIERGYGVALAPSRRLPRPGRSIRAALAGVGDVLVLVAVRIAAQTQLHGIDLKRDCELVHRAFERVNAGRGARRAHVAGGRNVERDELVRVSGVGATCRAGPTNRCRCARNPRIARSRRSPRG